MPIPPSSAYVTVETVTTLIRALANDMLYSPAGEILTDTANFMLPLLNDALEWFESEVNNHGVETFTKETLLTPVLPLAAAVQTDPGQEVNIADLGYFDGISNYIAPQIPTDLQVPLFLWERQTLSVERWLPMQECPGGLPSCGPSNRLRLWEWHQDALFMPGATQTNDIKLRYMGTHAPFVSVDDTLYFRGATGPIAYKMLASYMASKNPEAAQSANMEANLRMSQITTRSSRMKQREYITRTSYGSMAERTRFFPPRN